MAEERVLVVAKQVFEDIGAFHGLNFNVDAYLPALFAPASRALCPARRREQPRFKQLIPYVIMTHDGKYLTYVRGKRAGETRLVGNRSIGIGGHINPSTICRSSANFGEHLSQRRQTRSRGGDDCGRKPHRPNRSRSVNDDSNDVG